MGHAAVFVDRDGTLNRRPPPHDYVRDASDFEWLRGAAEALARLSRAGLLVAVVSNQRGVARGLVTSSTLREIEETITREVHLHGGRVTAFRYCMHEISEGCNCRKPKPGLLLALAHEFDLDLERSWMIGDADTDVMAGQRAGCSTIRIGRPDSVSPDYEAASLAEASEHVLSSPRREGHVSAENSAIKAR